MKDFENYKSELDNLYLEEQSSKEDYELSLEQSILEQQLVQEMIFNKDDLQDPKTLEKILEKMKKREPVFETVALISSFLVFCLSIAISIITTGVFTIVLSPFFIILSVILYMYIDTIPGTQFKKDNEKFKKKVIKLKEKSQEKLDKETDHKKKAKYQEIIKNCDKVLKAIENQYKKYMDIKSSEYDFDEDDKNTLINTYEDLVDFLEYPFDFGWENGIEDIALLAELLKLKPQDITNKIKRTKFKKEEKTVYDMFCLMHGEDTVDTGLNDPDNFEYKENFIIKYKSIMNMKAIETGSNDDNIDFVAQNGIFYSLTTDNEVEEGNMLKFAEYSSHDEWDKSDKKFMKMLIEVDKELGYYLLSDCPPGLKKKKFPL